MTTFCFGVYVVICQWINRTKSLLDLYFKHHFWNFVDIFINNRSWYKLGSKENNCSLLVGHVFHVFIMCNDDILNELSHHLDIFWKAYKVNSVLSVHEQIVFKFLSASFKRKIYFQCLLASLKHLQRNFKIVLKAASNFLSGFPCLSCVDGRIFAISKWFQRSRQKLYFSYFSQKDSRKYWKPSMPDAHTKVLFDF